MKTILRSQQDIKELGTILGIWAHPDDEVFSMGGVMAAAVRNGQTVACVTATYGEAGVQDETRWPKHKLGEIRQKELADSYKILEVHNHHWLNYPDGACNQVDEESAVKELMTFIDKYKPDSILTFGPDGITGHDDHKTVSNWASIANQRVGSGASVYHAIHTCEQYDSLRLLDEKLNIYFNIQQPCTCEKSDCAIHFELDDKLFEQKLTALKAMPSQTDIMMSHFDTETLRSSFGVEAFKRA